MDYVKPGDRVEVIGIYRALGVRLNAQRRTLKNVYRTYIDVVKRLTLGNMYNTAIASSTFLTLIIRRTQRE